MDQDARLRMDVLEVIASQEPHYQELLFQLREMEARYNSVLSRLSAEEQNAICDFISQCEEISWYMLELACRFVRFP